MKRTNYATLEQGPHTLDGVRVNVAACIFLLGMVDRLVPGVLVPNIVVPTPLVGVDRFGIGRNGVVNELVQNLLAGRGDVLQANVATTLDCADYEGLILHVVPTATNRCATNPSLIDFDHARQQSVGSFQGFTDAMRQVQGGLVSDVDGATELTRRDGFFTLDNEVDSDEPLSQRQVGIVHDRVGGDAELIPAVGTLKEVPVG